MSEAERWEFIKGAVARMEAKQDGNTEILTQVRLEQVRTSTALKSLQEEVPELRKEVNRVKAGLAKIRTVYLTVVAVAGVIWTLLTTWISHSKP